MKLLYIAPASNPHSIRWIKKLNQIINFDLITWITYEPISKNIIDPKLNIKYIKLKNIFDLKIFTVLFLKYDYVHVHSLARYLVPSLFVNCKKLILTAWGSDLYFARKNIFIRLLQNLQIKRSKIITCDSDELINDINKIHSSNKIRRINFGTDCEIFKPSEKKNDNKKYILSTRNFYDVYDIKTIVKAYALLNDDIKKEYKLLLIGKGPCKKQLLQLIKEKNLKEYLDLPGYVNQEELVNLYSNCAIYISSSLSDAGLAASTAEAMACGAICIVTDIKENNSWVNTQLKTGELFRAGDVKQLKDKINYVLALSSEKKQLISKNARKVISKKCNINVEMEKFSKLMLSI